MMLGTLCAMLCVFNAAWIPNTYSVRKKVTRVISDHYSWKPEKIERSQGHKTHISDAFFWLFQIDAKVCSFLLKSTVFFFCLFAESQKFMRVLNLIVTRMQGTLFNWCSANTLTMKLEWQIKENNKRNKKKLNVYENWSWSFLEKPFMWLTNLLLFLWPSLYLCRNPNDDYEGWVVTSCQSVECVWWRKRDREIKR